MSLGRCNVSRTLRFFIALVAIITLCTVIHMRRVKNVHMARRCYTSDHLNLAGIQLLPDISEAEPKPKLGRTVFFHETSCTEGIVNLNARQACAIESAALTNPAWDVFVLFASPSGFANHTEKPATIRALETYPNIRLRNADIWKYARETPIEQFMRKEYLFQSDYINSHTSDYMRYLSLFKWGGIYLDLDVIVKRNLSTIPPNYAGAESANYVAAGVLNLDSEGQGHWIAEQCLDEFERGFDGWDWGHNGPGVITRVLQRVCRTKYPPLMTRSRCKSFEVFPIESFYAIHWLDWRFFFDEAKAEEALLMTRDSVVVHVWNKHSVHEKLRVGSKAAYSQLADEYCPRVYASCGEYF